MIRLFRRRPAASTASVVYAVPGAVGVLGLRDGELAPEAAERLAVELHWASAQARTLTHPTLTIPAERGTR